jgi:serine/threonine-protein phosphatase PGAM5
MFRRATSRLFCSARVSERKSSPALGLALKGGAIVLAAGAGSLLYDYLSQLNMEKLAEDHDWDDDWDRYARVPRELHQDIKEWFIAPDADIQTEREKYDIQNSVAVRDIVMVRHGQYITTPGPDFGNLTAVGNEQARITAERLRQLFGNHKQVRCIYHSDLPRAKQTAEAIANVFPGVPVRETSLLAEAIPAQPNPPTTNCPEYIPAEGERLEKAFRSFFARPLGETTEAVDIIVGHGNCFRFFICRAMQIDPRYWLRMAIYNCGISRVEVDANGGVSVKAVGDVGHLPPKSITYS